ncbi:MAG: 16S rRNA (adenine(1518)-N(6)/adenine(1519)-N(6))-dimethyltransferase, partial [Cellvibrionaceae bacterium]|nr:16S rRNA (adenine(1518)-N(6)/adenine(1519)-N(6))-dimethyltransferase [Cellvibrionaceae bacterium]
YHSKVQDMHFMLQKEVVERMAASPGQKAYGRLGIMVQYYCQVENLFLVPPECFVPQPKVDSAIVRLKPYSEPPHPAKDVKLLERVVNVAFQQRRKTLRNGLKQLAGAETLDQLSTDISQRAENLSVAEFVTLADELLQLGVKV